MKELGGAIITILMWVVAAIAFYVIAVVTAVPAYFLCAFIVLKFWAWFIPVGWHLTAPPLLALVGIRLILNLMVPNSTTRMKDNGYSRAQNFWHVVSFAYIYPLLTWAMGAGVHWWFG